MLGLILVAPTSRSDWLLRVTRTLLGMFVSNGKKKKIISISVSFTICGDGLWFLTYIADDTLSFGLGILWLLGGEIEQGSSVRKRKEANL